MTRKAISPRFAINTFLNTDAHRHTVKLKTKGTERVPDVSSVVASDRFTTPRLPSMAFKAQADVLALNGAGISLGVVNGELASMPLIAGTSSVAVSSAFSCSFQPVQLPFSVM